MKWEITYGIPQGKGGWLITEQRIVAASDYFSALSQARHACKHGETVQDIREIVVSY